ncbi:MAG: hypothetical protein ABW078_14880 [Sedimenticola sp.]
MSSLIYFKAYGVCGKLGEQLNDAIVYRIDHACAQYLEAKREIVVGDAWLTRESLKKITKPMRPKQNMSTSSVWNSLICDLLFAFPMPMYYYTLTLNPAATHGM